MTLTPPPPRVRRRLGLYDLEHDVRAQHGWIDRLKFGLPGIAINAPCSGDGLVPYLDARRDAGGRLFTVDHPPGRRVMIEFAPTRWHFRLQIHLWFSDGRWAGAASVELNPTRLFATIADNHDLIGQGLAVTRNDLLISRRRPRPHTLDEKDNFVEPQHIAAAMACSWPALCQLYAAAVREAVGECLGTAQQFSPRGAPNEWLVCLPPFSAWKMKEAEVYFEFRDPEAPLRVAAISGAVRSLAATFAEDYYSRRDAAGRGPLQDANDDQEAIMVADEVDDDDFVDDARAAIVPGVARDGNMPSIRIGLGAEGVYLAMYAKAMERVRMEVRYRGHPLTRGCRVALDNFSHADTAVRDMMVAVTANATRRANCFLHAYRRHRGSREAGLFPLITALTSIMGAAGASPFVLNRVLTLLIAHGGLSRSTDPQLDRVIDALVASRVLVAANMTLRRRGTEFALAAQYADSFRHLRETGYHHYR